MNIFGGKYVDFGQTLPSSNPRNPSKAQRGDEPSFEPSPLLQNITDSQTQIAKNGPTPSKSAFTTSSYEKIQALERERELLYQEILRTKQADDQNFYDSQKLQTNQKMLTDFLSNVEDSLKGATVLNNSYCEMISKISSEKDEMRGNYHNKIASIEEILYLHKEKIDKMFQQFDLGSKTGFLEVFKEQISGVIHRISDCESFLDSLSKKEIAKVKMFIENRKKAEESFCGERKKYIEMIDNIQKAFDMKWEAKRAEIMREFKLVVEENSKLKEQNSHLLEENMFIQDNLENLKKISGTREEEL